MKNKQIKEKSKDVIEDLISFELLLSDIYFYFYSIFKDDKIFWWNLSIEEKNHAALLKTGKQFLEEKDCFPFDSLLRDAQEVKDNLLKTDKEFSLLKTKVISRKDAFKFALELEKSLSERQFQAEMKKKTNSKLLNVFQKLNQYNIDHEKRIKNYMYTLFNK